MTSVSTSAVALIFVVAAMHVHLTASAPAYVRKARNATRTPECTAFATTWDSCCDILRLMTNHTRSQVEAATPSTIVESSFNTSRATRQVRSTDQSATKPDANNTNSNSDTSQTSTNGSSSDATNSTTVATDTSANVTTTNLSGVYNLNHYGPFSATYGYCDMETDGGGWLVIFRREDDLNFDRILQEYEDGFGSLEAGKSFWYGLKALNHITTRGTWQLRVDLINEDEHIYAYYSSLEVGDASEGYVLRLGPYDDERSTAIDSLEGFNERMFLTSDNDQGNRCAQQTKGGWWFTDMCAAPKGGILTSSQPHLKGWYNRDDMPVNYDSTVLKIRQVECNI